MDVGLRENFSDNDTVRGVLRIIKPRIFKDMLINKGRHDGKRVKRVPTVTPGRSEQQKTISRVDVHQPK